MMSTMMTMMTMMTIMWMQPRLHIIINFVRFLRPLLIRIISAAQFSCRLPKLESFFFTIIKSFLLALPYLLLSILHSYWVD